MLVYVAFRFYTLKKMANINIPKGSRIIFSGNRQRAAEFLGIAKRRIHELKQMMRVNGQMMMQKLFYLDRDCVWVRIHIIDSAEFVVIHACSEGKEICDFSTVSPATTIVSEYQLTCPNLDLVPPDDPTFIQFDALFDVESFAGRSTRWHWGEGTVEVPDNGNNHTEFTYDKVNDEYDTKMQQWDIVTLRKTVLREGRSGRDPDQNVAYAKMLAKPWDPGGASATPPMYRLKWDGTQYVYHSFRETVTFDLGVGTRYPLDPRNVAQVIYDFANFPGTAHSTGLKSSLGGQYSGVDVSDQILEDMKGHIGTNDLQVIYSDISDYAPLPAIGMGGQTGWQSTVGKNTPNKIVNPDADKNVYVTRKTIKFKQVGSKWKITQKGGSIHERLDSVEIS